MIQLRHYLPGDERRLRVRADMIAAFDALGRRVHDGPKWCLVDDDVVLGIGGLAYDDHDDSWDLWGLASGGLRPRHWAMIFTQARELIREARKVGGRVWTTAADCDGAEAFIRRLGFMPSAKNGVFYV